MSERETTECLISALRQILQPHREGRNWLGSSVISALLNIETGFCVKKSANKRDFGSTKNHTYRNSQLTGSKHLHNLAY